jgi:hypothetical protein
VPIGSGGGPESSWSGHDPWVERKSTRDLIAHSEIIQTDDSLHGLLTPEGDGVDAVGARDSLKTCGGGNRTAKGAQAQSILRAPDNTPVPLVTPER